MQKTCMSMSERIKKLWVNTKRFIRRRYKGILYYSAVIAVLALIAGAAESYRSDKAGGQALILSEDMLAQTLSSAASDTVYPENMRLLRAFSDQMEWNGEMGQWEIHAANDYAFEDDIVVCLSGGVVRDAGESGVRGGYLEIEAADGKIYIYSSIKPDENILPGMEVVTGEAIARADDGMPNEMTMARHVHLEVYDGGVPVDFESIAGKD